MRRFSRLLAAGLARPNRASPGWPGGPGREAVGEELPVQRHPAYRALVLHPPAHRRVLADVEGRHPVPRRHAGLGEPTQLARPCPGERPRRSTQPLPRVLHGAKQRGQSAPRQDLARAAEPSSGLISIRANGVASSSRSSAATPSSVRSRPEKIAALSGHGVAQHPGKGGGADHEQEPAAVEVLAGPARPTRRAARGLAGAAGSPTLPPSTHHSSQTQANRLAR